ncbi:RpiB/LacA/LacB family sugar-phosphate isomerase [Ruthenibacterium sp. CLA-JM-H11]|uniref:RpiB/LacA/LacB family sugar-phosphate isomerase n=1 Tax=Ruthenibacterium intestinale TaxID=3133163 RepID=A0ABV1GEZ1_9FIRM
MKVAIACEASSFLLKEAVKKRIQAAGYEVLDVGQQTENENVLYFEAAQNLAKVIQSGECEKGIVICGTGAGVSMIVNKFRGVYCVACESVFTAEKISLINNANVLAMGARVVSWDMGGEMAEKFLAGKWCDGFETQRRLNNEKGYQVLKSIEEESFR